MSQGIAVMIETFQINGFQRECYVYHTLMKSYQRIRRGKELQELKIPRVLFSNETDGVLIMENLKAKGFKLLDRIHNEGNY